MLLNLKKIQRQKSIRTSAQQKKSLSTYFPKGTQYFYGYPSGEDSGFLNQVPPATEELVAERAVSCAGEHVSIVGFAATNSPIISKELMDLFGIPQLHQSQMIVLPKEIDSKLKGNERNNIIKKSIISSVDKYKFVMAQPFTSEDMQNVYQISPAITTWLNDKSSMSMLFSEDKMPVRLARYESGADFFSKYTSLELPCVVKAASSSAGDGVYICKTSQDLTAASKSLKHISATIIAERYIDAVKNYGVHFGIPHQSSLPVDFLGINEQLTTGTGEFIGGIIRSSGFPDEMAEIKKYLIEKVLPKVRAQGWYGVGCFDVLLDKQGNHYFIDCNFRMTGMSAYHFLVANNKINTPLIGFSGDFVGSQDDFEKTLYKFAGKNCSNKIMQIIALSNHGNNWSFNGALFFNDSLEMRQNIEYLLNSGIKSQALSLLLES